VLTELGHKVRLARRRYLLAPRAGGGPGEGVSGDGGTPGPYTHTGWLGTKTGVPAIVGQFRSHLPLSVNRKCRHVRMGCDPGPKQGRFVSGTTLPVTLPLFATGIGTLGLPGWRRKRKAKAAV
jgi:hypothetical protein